MSENLFARMCVCVSVTFGMLAKRNAALPCDKSDMRGERGRQTYFDTVEFPRSAITVPNNESRDK